MRFLISLHINPAVLDALTDEEKELVSGSGVAGRDGWRRCAGAGGDRVLCTGRTGRARGRSRVAHRPRPGIAWSQKIATCSCT